MRLNHEAGGAWEGAAVSSARRRRTTLAMDGLSAGACAQQSLTSWQ